MNPPKRGKKYKEVIERGCGLIYFEYEGDYDCEWKYEWECDHCPIVVEQNKQDVAVPREEVSLEELLTMSTHTSGGGNKEGGKE